MHSGTVWALVHTRLGTEYILPLLVAALPAIRELARLIGLRW
ncbi:MAG: hypothetical protein AB1762_16385 [Gemmatimonadota bacterium]